MNSILTFIASFRKKKNHCVKENRWAQQIVTSQQEKTKEKRTHSSVNQPGEKWLNEDADC